MSPDFGMGIFDVKDSGKRKAFSSGAVRDTSDGKPRPDLISPFALWRLGEHMRKGAVKYEARNYEAGMPFSTMVESWDRHALQWKKCERDEDHLSAVLFNVQAIIHFEEMIKLGQLPESLNDMPDYRKIVPLFNQPIIKPST